MCSTHSTTAEPNAELCDEVSQDHSWRIFARGEEKYSNPQVGQTAKGIICTHEEETLVPWTPGTHEGWVCAKETAGVCHRTQLTNCQRPASQMEWCSDKGPQAFWSKRRMERDGSWSWLMEARHCQESRRALCRGWERRAAQEGWGEEEARRERAPVWDSPQLWLARVHFPCNEQIWSGKPSMSVSWHSAAHPVPVLWSGVAVSGSTQPQAVLQNKTNCALRSLIEEPVPGVPVQDSKWMVCVCVCVCVYVCVWRRVRQHYYLCRMLSAWIYGCIQNCAVHTHTHTHTHTCECIMFCYTNHNTTQGYDTHAYKKQKHKSQPSHHSQMVCIVGGMPMYYSDIPHTGHSA